MKSVLVGDVHVKIDVDVAVEPPITLSVSPRQIKLGTAKTPEIGCNGNGLTKTLMDCAAKQLWPRGVPVNKKAKVPASGTTCLKVESVRVPFGIPKLDHK